MSIDEPEFLRFISQLRELTRSIVARSIVARSFIIRCDLETLAVEMRLPVLDRSRDKHSFENWSISREMA